MTPNPCNLTLQPGRHNGGVARPESADLQSIVHRALEQTVNGVAISDPKLPGNPLVHVNGGFTRITGYTAQEVLGRNCSFLQGDEHDQPGVHRLREAIARGEDATVVVRNYRRDGTPFWNRVEMSPVRDESTGHITHFFAVQTDVTLEREKEEATLVRSLELERTLFSHPLGLITVDREARVQLLSPACVDLLGLNEQEVKGLSLQAFIQLLASRSGVMPTSLAWPAPQSSVMWTLEKPIPRQLEVSVSPSGGLTGEQLAIVRDVTSQQQPSSRDQFLSMAAHELRTPLGSIRGYAELVLMRGYGAEQARPLLETVVKQAVRLGELLDDLLDLAQLDERGQEAFELQPVDLAATLASAREVIDLPDSRHTLTLDLPAQTIRVMGHAGRLEQVFINLLSNAVKYSPEGGQISCRVTLQAEPGLCSVSVSDQGIGMSAQALSKLFTRFFRADPGGSIPGTGLGLAIVKESVERMGGRIEVASEPGQGSTFTVHLRLAPK